MRLVRAYFASAGHRQSECPAHAHSTVKGCCEQVRISYLRRILTLEGEVTVVGQRLDFQDPPGAHAALHR